MSLIFTTNPRKSCQFFKRCCYTDSVVKEEHRARAESVRESYHPKNDAVKSVIAPLYFKILKNNPVTSPTFPLPPLVSFKPDKKFLIRRKPSKKGRSKRSVKIIDHFTFASSNFIHGITCTSYKTGKTAPRFREHRNGKAGHFQSLWNQCGLFIQIIFFFLLPCLQQRNSSPSTSNIPQFSSSLRRRANARKDRHF